MSELHDIYETSKDGRRKAEIKQNNVETILDLYIDDKIIMTASFSDKIFDLAEKDTVKRSYIDFADEFIEHGLGDRSLCDIHRIIFQDFDSFRRNITLFFIADNINVGVINNCMMLDIYTKNFRLQNPIEIKAKDNPSLGYTFTDFASKSFDEFLMLTDSWTLTTFGIMHYTTINEQRFCIYEELGMQYFIPESLLKIMSSSEYLVRIGFPRILHFLKLNNDNKKMISKARLCNRAIKIEGIDKDDFPLLSIVERAYFR